MALIQRRIDLLEPMRNLINPNSYYTLITEMAAELSDIYSTKFDQIYDGLTQGRTKMTKKVKAEANECARKCIEHSKYVVDTIYKSEDDKYEYVPAVINMELQSASRWTKIFPVDTKEQVENMKRALEAYERVRKFVNEFRKFSKVGSDKECLNKDGVTQM